MQLIDMSQIAIAALSTYVMGEDYDHDIGMDKPYAKYIVLNYLREINKKHSEDFGELVICCDSDRYWRKKIFAGYKHGRKASKEKSSINWEEIYELLNELLPEIAEYFPYKVIRVDYAEADDIIAVIAKDTNERVLIVSADHDFKQLQQYIHISQYNPIKREMVVLDVPAKEYLLSHILMGDKGDGVPNFKTPLDNYKTETRAIGFGPAGFNKIKDLPLDQILLTEQEKMRYKQNKVLVDFNCIPKYIVKNILSEFEILPRGNLNKAMMFFSMNKLKNMAKDINDFSVKKLLF